MSELSKTLRPTSIVLATNAFTLSGSRVSTRIAVAAPPDSRTSRSTVLMVDWGEFGSGGKGWDGLYASLVVLAATTTVIGLSVNF